MPRFRRAHGGAALALTSALVVAALPGTALGQVPDPAPPSTSAPIGDDLTTAAGRVEVVVQLSTPPLAASLAPDALVTGGLPPAAEQQTLRAAVTAEQDALAPALTDLGATELARLDLALNAVVVALDADQLDALASLPGVRSVRRVRDHVTAPAPSEATSPLAEAADAVGARALRDAGVDGTGVRVAVLDSGIDYTHADFGGPGTPAAYQSCARTGADAAGVVPATATPTGACAAAFGPAAPKVKGGVDLVGETWPQGERQPDPNPIDREGHGTHVADILAGRTADGRHVGLAPGADLYAVKVCSAVSTACSGIALLQGVDRALDPDGDGTVDDAVDIVNLSLGADYGTGGDDLSDALANANRLGVLVVASAGNGADHPYVVSAPSTSPAVLSVAETATPAAHAVPITVQGAAITGIPEGEIADAVPQAWAPSLPAALTAPAAVPAAPVGCSRNDFASFPPGAIAVTRRGGCDVSRKSDQARRAGAAALLVVDTAGGVAPTYSSGGGTPLPTFSINKTYGDQLLAAAQSGAVTLTIDPARTVSRAGTVVPSSSRGPALDGALVKPDLGAPGAWRSAAAGTGGEDADFGGTSGAAPTVAGAAALLLQRIPTAAPRQIGAMLVSGADTTTRALEPDGGTSPAPVARVGGGELRVDRAAGADAVLRAEDAGVGLTFGTVDVTAARAVTRRVVVTNLTADTRTYDVTFAFRDPVDAALKAVTPHAPPQVTVGPFATATVPVTLLLDPGALPAWPLAGRAGGAADGAVLTGPEIDGFLTMSAGSEAVHLPWQVLPRRASALAVADAVALGATGRAQLKVRNLSPATAGRLEAYSLTGTSPTRGADGAAAAVDLAAVGVRADQSNVQFAIATYDRRALPLAPARFLVRIDTDGDGQVDHEVYNTEREANGPTGQDVVAVQEVGDGASGRATAHYYSIGDVNSSTTVFTVPLAALGAAQGTSLGFEVLAYDRSGTGAPADTIADQTFTVGAPLFTLVEGLEAGAPAAQTTRLTVQATGAAGPSSETGLLLLTPTDATADFHAVAVYQPAAG